MFVYFVYSKCKWVLLLTFVDVKAVFYHLLLYEDYNGEKTNLIWTNTDFVVTDCFPTFTVIE